MLTLFHAPMSRSTRFLWLLEELGAPYKVRYVSIPRRDAPDAQPDPANPHPDKKVPALVHDGALVHESAAIALYLTDAFPQAGMGPLPGDPKRAEYLTWLAYYAGVIEPTMVLRFSGMPAMDGPGGWGRPAAMEAKLKGAFDPGPYMLGERFSALDILIGSMGQWSREMLPPGEAVDAYLKRIGERPALARAMAKDAAPG